MQAIAAHLSPFRDRRDRDFGRDSRRQGCATGPISLMVFSHQSKTTIDNDKTNVEPMHSYDAFHMSGVKGIIGMHRFNICLVVPDLV